MQFLGRMRRASLVALVVAGWIGVVFSGVPAAAQQDSMTSLTARAVLDKYCVTCHNQKLHTADLALDTVDVTNPSANGEVWERVIQKLRAGSMPPPGRPRPDAATYRAMAGWLEG